MNQKFQYAGIIFSAYRYYIHVLGILNNVIKLL